MTHWFQHRRRLLAMMAATPLYAAAQPVLSNERGIKGRLAPELDAAFWLDAQGEKGHFSVKAHRGKWVYLKFWQSWCPGCHSSGFPTLKKVTDALADEPLFVAAGLQTTFEGHQTNTADKVRKTQLRYELAIPMGHDPGQHNPGGYPHAMRSYRSGGTPWQVVIDPEGRVIFDGFHVDADQAIAFFKAKITEMRTG